jgi:hypothetical protein
VLEIEDGGRGLLRGIVWLRHLARREIGEQIGGVVLREFIAEFGNRLIAIAGSNIPQQQWNGEDG